MSLEEIKNSLNTICLSHKQIQYFHFGEEFSIDDSEHQRGQQAFLEIPYSINYDLSTDRKEIQFALLILFPSVGIDGVKQDHTAISHSETIGDSIIRRFQKEAKLQSTFVESVNGVSLRNVSSADLCGFRFELTVRTQRSSCNNQDYLNDFN